MTESPPPASAPSARVYKFRGEGTGLFQSFCWNAGKILSRLLSIVLFRLHAAGTRHIPRTGPVLMVTNHQSFLDPWLIGIAPPRQIHYMARDTLFRGWFAWVIETLNAFPVKRGHGDRQAIRMAAERLDKGFVVNIFPEGTRSEDGTIGPIAPGVALILNLVKQPVPIVPVVIDGAFAAWPRQKKLPRPKPIRLIHGEPIPAEVVKNLSPDELAARIRAELVRLQAQIGSPYAEASARRLEEETRQAAAAPTRTRRKPR